MNPDALLNFLLIACATYTALYLTVAAAVLACRFISRTLFPTRRPDASTPPLAPVVPLRRGVATPSGPDPAGATPRSTFPGNAA